MKSGLQYFYGIDFGTTNTAAVGFACKSDGAREEILFGDEEQRPIPSVVAINKTDGTVYTGRDAWERKTQLSEDCEYISSVKSLLDKDWKKDIAGKTWTPELVAAEVFKGIQKNVVESTGNEIRNAVVAIPIGFLSAKRKMIRKAAARAGISITTFISEPTAAFFANYKDIRNAETVAVFDWGGGTLDVSVLRHQNGRILELATGGRPEAGDVIDMKIAKKVHAKIARKRKVNISFEDMPPRERDMMLVKAEGAKRALSDEDSATIAMNKYGQFGIVRENFDYDLFSEIIDDNVNDAISCFNKVIAESGVGLSSIDKIIMVGGSSNLRPLIDKLEDLFGDKLYFTEKTMWNVGIGAAMLAATPGSYFSNQRLGIKLSDSTLFPLIEPDEKLKGWQCEHYFGIVDTNKEARFVFAGSKDLDEDDTKYCTLPVPSYRFLQEQIVLDAYVDDDLVFNATASSTMNSIEHAGVWKYERLKCYYKLPEE
jgi:molecular chaperone DnaK